MRLYLEDNKGSKLVKILCNFLLFFFFSISISLSQVKVSGFYFSNSYKTFKDYSVVYQTDFNKDSVPDIILFNGNGNNVVIHEANKDGTFAEAKTKFFFFPITALSLFEKNKTKTPIYIFVSRKERLAGLASFTKYGTLKLLNIARFNTYPSKVIVADLNNDGKNEALIFGNTFAGITMLRENNFRIKDTSITSEGSYSDAAFIDLDYDGYYDFAATNMLHNSIDFFYNDGNNSFVKERQLILQNPIANLKTVNFNNDIFDDLIYTSADSFHVLLGDSVSSFNNSVVVPADDNIFNFEVGDFNSDKLQDIIYIGNKKSVVKIIFGAADSTFSEPILFYHHKDLSNMYYAVNGEKKNLLILSSDGHLFNFTNSFALSDSFNLAFSGAPSKLSWKVYPQNKIVELSFIDNYDQKYKSFIGNNSSFLNYNEAPISEGFSNIEILNSVDILNVDLFLNFDSLKNSHKPTGREGLSSLLRKDVKSKIRKPIPKLSKIASTLFFNRGEQLIEFLHRNFKTQLYTKHPIMDAKPFYFNDVKNPSILTVTSGDSLAFVSLFNYRDSSYDEIVADTLDKNVVSAQIVIGKNPEVFYWKHNDDSLYYLHKNVVTAKTNKIYSAEIQKDSVNQSLTTVKLFENDMFPTSKPISLIKQKDYFLIIIRNHEKTQFVKLSKENVGNKIKNINQIKYFYDDELRQKVFFILANDSTSIFKLDLDKKFTLLSLSKSIESSKIYDYFVTKLFDKFDYLVYSSGKASYIKFLRIK